MGSDRARVSYDARQHYRSVVMQQGRVTLEADWNENQSIAGEALREETLDIVGPSGTPDGGYRVLPAGAPFDFKVAAGTAYVGGLRLVLDQDVRYSQQRDWLDYALDPDWVDPAQVQPGSQEYVYLWLREQEVSAVEDGALREVALGGPDTAQRSRLIQRIVRLGVQSADCAGGLAAAKADWAKKGLLFDDATRRLNPQSTLIASFPNAPQAIDPCEPEVAGGYLGADNQLIRVQITGADSLVWGFDNASFLYRATVNADRQTLTLQSQPVDAFHQPQTGQAVEVLRSAARLANGEYAASATSPPGALQTLGSAYNPDTLQIALPAQLPAEYVDPAQTPQVFLRVWQAQLTFTPGKAVELGDTGLFVTLDTSGGAPFHVGDYWLLAVRPTTATAVYPQRYLDAPQPPDGPRLWACPLAAIHWDKRGVLTVGEYCLPPFDNLVDLSRRKGAGCCTVSVTPADLTGGKRLQTVIDSLAGRGPARLCLGPGEYSLDAPLKLDSRHASLSIEACPGGAVLRAQTDPQADFSQGLIVLSAADNVSLRGLTLALPLAPFTTGTGDNAFTLYASNGLRPVDCAQLSVEDCAFVFPPPPQHDVTPRVGAGILAGGECVGWRLARNRFTGPANAEGVPAGFIAGFALYPSSSVAATVGKSLSSWLDRALLQDNAFDNLALAVLSYADCGLVELESNTVRQCANGFVFFSLPTLGYVANMAQAVVAQPQAQAAVSLHNALFSILANPAFQTASAVLRGFPVPADYAPPKMVAVTPDPALKTNIAGLQRFYDQALPVAAAATPHCPEAQAPAGLIQSFFFALRNVLDGTAASPAAATPAAAATVGTVKLVSQSLTLTAHPLASIQPVPVSLAALNQNLGLVEKQVSALLAARSIPLSLRFVGNEVWAQGQGTLSGTCVFVYSLDTDDRDTISLTGNTLIGASDAAYQPVATLVGGSRCTVAGNTILNEGSNAALLSLVVFPRYVTPSSRRGGGPAAASAITGNVLRGLPILPPRNLSAVPPAPMDRWEFFNSIT